MISLPRRLPLLLIPILILFFSACNGTLYQNASPVVFSTDGATVEGSGAVVSTGEDGVTVTITSGGAYRLSGECRNGAVVVNCADEVTLVLDGLTLTHPTGSCIASVGEGNLVLYVCSGTESTLTDGTGYVFPDAVTDEPDAVVFAKSDLTLAGDDDGICHMVAYYKTGAATKDDFTLTGGNYTVSSIRHGICGRDSVTITDGCLAMEAAADGIRTTNDNPGKEGTVTISGGRITIAASDEAIQSISDITITGGEITLDSTNNGIKTDGGTLQITGGTVSLTAPDEPIIAAAVTHTGGVFTVNGTDYAG